MTYVKINDAQYSASITGRLHDGDWDNRESKAIMVEMSYEDALSLFVDGTKWSIVQENEEMVEKHDVWGDVVLDENGEVVFELAIVTEEYDNSDYSIAGDITNHRNGYVTIKMGKPTASEVLAILIGGELA